MSNNKQSSVEGLAVRLKEKMQVWNFSKNHQEFHIILEAGEFAKLIDEAKAMHKEEIIQAYSNGWHDGQDAIIMKIEHIDKGGDERGLKYYEQL